MIVNAKRAMIGTFAIASAMWALDSVGLVDCKMFSDPKVSPGPTGIQVRPAAWPALSMNGRSVIPIVLRGRDGAPDTLVVSTVPGDTIFARPAGLTPRPAR